MTMNLPAVKKTRRNLPPGPGPGRPKGLRNKRTLDMRALASPHGPESIQLLLKIARTGESEAARVSAIRELLDRGYGKAPQPLVGDDSRPIIHAIRWLPPLE